MKNQVLRAGMNAFQLQRAGYPPTQQTQWTQQTLWTKQTRGLIRRTGRVYGLRQEADIMKWCKRIGILCGAAVVGMVFFNGAPAAMAAGLFSPTGGGASNEPTEIVSDRLVNNNTEKVAEFTGAVKATQGNFSITADTLRIFYEGDLINPPKEKSAKSQVTKMVAIGHVHIISDQYVADSGRAEYDPATDVLTLIGENSRVTSGENSITGSKIILNRRDGKSFAESSGTSRVKAVLHQGAKEGEGAKKEGEAPKADKPAEKKQ